MANRHVLWLGFRVAVLLLGAAMVTGLFGGCGSDDTALIELPEGAVEFDLIGADENGDLWVLDESSGELLTMWLDTDDEGSDLGTISGAVPVFSESDLPTTGTAIGTLYAGTGGTGGAPNCGGCVYTIDPETGAATLRTSASLDDTTFGNVSSMTLQADGTVLFTANDALHTLDPATDEVTLIGNLPCCGFGMTFDATGTLYQGGGTSLYEIDPADASDTLVAAFSYSGFAPNSPQLVAMTTHPETGQVLAVLNDGSGNNSGDPTPRYLVDVNVETAEITLIGETEGRLDGLTYVPFDVTGEEQ